MPIDEHTRIYLFSTPADAWAFGCAVANGDRAEVPMFARIAWIAEGHHTRDGVRMIFGRSPDQDITGVDLNPFLTSDRLVPYWTVTTSKPKRPHVEIHDCAAKHNGRLWTDVVVLHPIAGSAAG